MVEKARKKLTDENIKHGTPEDKARQLIEGWLDYAREPAAKLILEKGSAKECFEHIRNKTRGLGGNAVAVTLEQSVEWVLDYYGIDKNKAQNMIEGGLMYAIYTSISNQWKPYQASVPISAADKAPKKNTFKPVSLEDLL